MRPIHLGLLAIAADAAYGYLDTSPFFLFSTSELLTTSSQLKSSASLTSDIAATLSQCPSDFYIIVSQPGVNSADYAQRKANPELSQRMNGLSKSIRSSASIAEVVGEVDAEKWQELLQTSCGAQVTNVDAASASLPASYDSLPRVLNVFFPAPSASRRNQDLLDNDSFLGLILDIIPSQKYTVLFTTTPGLSARKLPFAEQREYEMDSPIYETYHMDMKRDLSYHASNLTNNQTLIDGPLFEKYQFFTPGIFMGFLVGFLLLSILYVAISGIASLEVSYAAFDKENGPAAQKRG